MEYVYNDQTSQVSLPGGRIVGAHNIVEFDANGNRRQKFYDGLNHLTKLVDPFNRAVGFEYDGMNLRKLTDKKGHVTEYFYDENNRVVRTEETGSPSESPKDPAGTGASVSETVTEPASETVPIARITNNETDKSRTLCITRSFFEIGQDSKTPNGGPKDEAMPLQH